MLIGCAAVLAVGSVVLYVTQRKLMYQEFDRDLYRASRGFLARRMPRFGRGPRTQPAAKLPEGIDAYQVYREEARYLERTAPWVERVGLQYIKDALLDDATRIRLRPSSTGTSALKLPSAFVISCDAGSPVLRFWTVTWTSSSPLSDWPRRRSASPGPGTPAPTSLSGSWSGSSGPARRRCRDG